MVTAGTVAASTAGVAAAGFVSLAGLQAISVNAVEEMMVNHLNLFIYYVRCWQIWFYASTKPATSADPAYVCSVINMASYIVPGIAINSSAGAVTGRTDDQWHKFYPAIQHWLDDLARQNEPDFHLPVPAPLVDNQNTHDAQKS